MFKQYQNIYERKWKSMDLEMLLGLLLIVVAAITILIVILIIVVKEQREKKYLELETEVLGELGISNWNIVEYFDALAIVKSRQALEKYDDIKFFRENQEMLPKAKFMIQRKNEVAAILKNFLNNNRYKTRSQYSRLITQINTTLTAARAYRISVNYITSAHNLLARKEIALNENDIDKFYRDPSLLMGKAEYNRMMREQQKEVLTQKQREFYDRVNQIIDYANVNKDTLVNKTSLAQVDNLIAQLFDRTVNSIKKVKAIESEEWHLIDGFIHRTGSEIERIVNRNHMVLAYYNSPAFLRIKETCEGMMSSQREFNEYITEKVESISKLFGTRVVRNETLNDDEYNYLRPYRKTITPFTAEVSAAVFASAENNPLDYVVKYFYPNKKTYPEQIQKLYLLVEELETLREAKQIIENYKAEYQQYLGDVPDYIMQEDEAGFYARLGFANIDESVLTVEYKFTYTSGGGMAQRSFTVPMTEETIVELIQTLENKLTAKEFAKDQRRLMTKKLRDFIKNRDNYTCCTCGNSTHAEPNLLLEIDHIIPVAKGGCTEEGNLQTLCWKCNRSKGDKIIQPQAQ